MADFSGVDFLAKDFDVGGDVIDRIIVIVTTTGRSFVNMFPKIQETIPQLAVAVLISFIFISSYIVLRHRSDDKFRDKGEEKTWSIGRKRSRLSKLRRLFMRRRRDQYARYFK